MPTPAREETHVPALLLGSISAIADTSEVQRQAFNDAFAAHGLDWTWDRDTYRDMLRANGGADRIAAHAREVGADVDVDAIHRRKGERFRELLATHGAAPRPGLPEVLAAALDRGRTLGVVTTTAPENVAAVLAAAGLDESAFDLVLTRADVTAPKPDPEVWTVALDRLGLDPGEVVAVEDNAGGVRSAVDAGIRCLALPNANTVGHDFPGAVAVVDRLDPDDVDRLLDAPTART